MYELGFEPGDIVTVSFLDKSYDLPIVSDYTDIDSQKAALFFKENYDNIIILAVNAGDFITRYGIGTKTSFEDQSYVWNLDEGISEPLEITITMKEKSGYLEQYLARHIFYTNERSDYPWLSDEQFANFREVNTTGIGKHTLFRSASAIDNRNKRATYVNEALRKNHVEIAIDFADDPKSVGFFPGYDESYYATTRHLELNAGMDFISDSFAAKLLTAFTFMAENEGIYDVFCLEGKDRTGFVVALLECLAGAT